jgi:ketosteroid isomerase-like protein
MHFKKKLVLFAALFCWISATQSQTTVDVANERPMIEARLKEYSKYLLDGDSVSIAAMYAIDGTIGCKKGPEILSSAGSWVRSSVKNDSRYVTFNIVTLTADGDLLIETGKAEGKNGKGELKYTFRYVVVWKKENGLWKLYRDIGL